MRYLHHRASGLTLVFFILVSTFCSAQEVEKKKINSERDLPRFVYPLKGSASELLQANDAEFETFTARVCEDLDSILRDFAIEDKSTRRVLLNARVDLQVLFGEYQAALGTINEVRVLQEKPAAKLTIGIVNRAIVQAALETKATSGPVFEQTFQKRATEAINALPWDVVQDEIKELYAGSRLYSGSVAIAGVNTDLDPALQKSGALDNKQAWQLIGIRNDLHFFMPLEPVLVASLKQYIAAHADVKPDIWEAREVTLRKEQKLTPVFVAMWDSGTDISLFPDQVFTDERLTASGAHGLAYDNIGGHSTSWLYPLTPEQQKAYPEFGDEIKGFQDLENRIDSPEADEIQKNGRNLSPDQLHQVFEMEKWNRSVCRHAKSKPRVL